MHWACHRPAGSCDVAGAAESPSLAQFVIAPGRKDHSIVSFMALRIIGGDMCWETSQNVRFEEMGLGVAKRNRWRSGPGAMEHRRCRDQQALREAGFLHMHRPHLGPADYVCPEPQQPRNEICWALHRIADESGSRTGGKMTKLPKPICRNSGWNLTAKVRP